MYINCSALCHNLFFKDFDNLSLPKDITLVHCIDNFMLFGLSKQEVETTVVLFVRHLHVRRWKINPTKIQGPSTSVKFLGVHCYGECWNTPCKVTDKLLYPATPTLRKRGTMLSWPLNLKCNVFLIWMCCSGPFTEWITKLLFIYFFVCLWSPQNKKALQQVQATMKNTLPLAL